MCIYTGASRAADKSDYQDDQRHFAGHVPEPRARVCWILHHVLLPPGAAPSPFMVLCGCGVFYNSVSAVISRYFACVSSCVSFFPFVPFFVYIFCLNISLCYMCSVLLRPQAPQTSLSASRSFSLTQASRRSRARCQSTRLSLRLCRGWQGTTHSSDDVM